MTTRVGPAGMVLGGGSMSSDSYADFLGQEYPASYLPSGGGSVKIVVAGELAWINEWDLVRLDPDYGPVTEAIDIPGNYGEIDELDDDSSS